MLAGDLDSILVICNGLKTQFAHLPSSASTRVQRSLVYSTVEKEDMRVFTWVGQQTGKDVTSYSVYVVTYFIRCYAVESYII